VCLQVLHAVLSIPIVYCIRQQCEFVHAVGVTGVRHSAWGCVMYPYARAAAYVCCDTYINTVTLPGSKCPTAFSGELLRAVTRCSRLWWEHTPSSSGIGDRPQRNCVWMSSSLL
jgi:hypothetical protein